jgi:hypothetical protein
MLHRHLCHCDARRRGGIHHSRVCLDMTVMHNNQLQRMAACRRGCNRRASWPPSLSFCR